jgi:tRNA-specific 2-thiouridylase
MDALAFEHHLTSPQGHGEHAPGAHIVAAEGGSCCDQITFSIAVAGDRVMAAGFDANGCGSAYAAASAAVTLAREATVLEAARIGPRQVAEELGGLSPAKWHAAELAADALARALGTAVRADARLQITPGATLVAMSGGVDSAVAAHLCVAGGKATAVTLELWSDRENDAETSCCSASAVAQARALAHSMGMAHFTIDLRR